MSKRQIFSVARRASSYSLDDTTQFWRQYKMWEYQQGNLPEVGMLQDDQLNHYSLGNLPAKGRVRLGDASNQQWLFRMQRGSDISAAYDQLPHEEQPNYSADHKYLSSTVMPQMKAEYEEQHLIEMVTNQFDDMHHKIRNCGWFGLTRLMQIQSQKSKVKSNVGVLNADGQIERQETIGASLARSAF